MELMFQWFWLLKLLAFTLFIYSVYKIYKTKGKSKFWIGMAIIQAILAIVAPVKLDTGTTTQQHL